MSITDYFGDWGSVVNLEEANRLTRLLVQSKETVCPNTKDIFKAFHLCSLNNLKVVIIGQDPYPTLRSDKTPVATGLAFANSSDTPLDKLSPSLKKLRESVIDFTRPHGIVTFDTSLEKWEKQGVLLLNSALTCLAHKPASHTLMWRPFITSLLSNLSLCRPGMIYILMGNDAQALESYINKRLNTILRTKHPAYYAKNQTRMPSDIWQQVNNIIKDQYGYKIQWYEEY